MSQPSIVLSSTPAQKRKLRDTNFEIADSDDEDYGWGDEDDADIPPMPSQWQGSEDLIIGTRPPSDEEDEEDEEDELEGGERGEGESEDRVDGEDADKSEEG